MFNAIARETGDTTDIVFMVSTGQMEPIIANSE